MTEKRFDEVVESVRKQFLDRSEVGIKKYGTTLEENNNDDFLQHLKEELMDAVLYIEKLQSLGASDILNKYNKVKVAVIDKIENNESS